MKAYILLLISFGIGAEAFAQFRVQGSIEYTRSVNMKMSMQLEASDDFKNSSYFKEAIKNTPNNYPSYFQMSFNNKSSHYYFLKDGDVKTGMYWDNKIASENIVVKDFEHNILNAQKEIFEKNYIVNDSLPTFKWKIHDDVREIAGFQCRKATTTIHDSVVVVAYYTDQILVSSGPESFGGLPGMILGLAIPRLYTTWFATKVTDVEIDEKDIKKIKKGKSTTISNMLKEVESSLNKWGNWGHPSIWKTTF